MTLPAKLHSRTAVVLALATIAAASYVDAIGRKRAERLRPDTPAGPVHPNAAAMPNDAGMPNDARQVLAAVGK